MPILEYFKKEDRLSVEAIKAFESVRYMMFHYLKNAEATPFELVAPTCLVYKKDIPEGYLIRQEKDAKQFLLIEYNACLLYTSLNLILFRQR